MAESLGTAELDGFPDRSWTEGFAGVDREMEVLPLQVLEGIQVEGGWIPGLPAGYVEPDDAAVPVPDGGLCHRHRVRRRAHGRDQGPNRQPRSGCTIGETRQDRFDHLVE